MYDVLYIDPDHIVATSVTDYFATKGTKVTWAKTPQQALQLLETHTPRVVVIELALGEHGGLELLHEIKSYPEWQAVPVVVFSHQALHSYEERLRRLGIIKVLYKPNTTLESLYTQVIRSI